MVAWFILILVSIALQAVSYLLQPKPKKAKPEAAKQLEDPQASAGMVIGIPFGTVTISELNVLWYGEKQTRQYKVKA